MQKLLIVEDEPDIRESLEDFFRRQEFLVTAAGSARDAHTALSNDSFSMILLDLLLPDGDGLDLLSRIRRAGDHTPVIVLTARGEEKQRILGLKRGADDYLVKPFSLSELAARIDAVLRRSGAAPCEVSIGEARVDLSGHEVKRGRETHRLLQKEAELLSWLLRHPGRTFRREELLREVWGYDATPTTRTVDTHIFNLRKKIEPEPDNPQHILTVHGVGYRLVL